MQVEPHAYMTDPSTRVPQASYPLLRQQSAPPDSGPLSFPFRPSTAGPVNHHPDISSDALSRNEANISKRRTRLADLMATPPRRSHSTLSQEIFSDATSGMSSPTPASFFPSADNDVNNISTEVPRNASHVWAVGMSTIPARPSLSTSTSSSSEWTDDEKFLTIRPAVEGSSAEGMPEHRRRRRYTAEKLPRPCENVLSTTPHGKRTSLKPSDNESKAPASASTASRLTGPVFSGIFKSTSASRLNSTKPLTPRPARFVDFCKSKTPKKASKPLAGIIPDDEENLDPNGPTTPVRGDTTSKDTPVPSSATAQLSPLSPNVEIYRGSARHRHRTPLVHEDANPFKDLAPTSDLSSSGSDADDSEDDGSSTLITPTPVSVLTYF
ncbi:hypothetical protein C1H76_4777 [Elsinoe australis]|uniref:Uncharacterized protein n=1 Tax=Elsinoe australis TaxID=40998 RepID=A0A4U7AWU5_9PEZI|nr:hypothetical protein C1H76_4777 [Elsinoe australis]